MGYAHYVLADGREAGYGVSSTCEAGECEEKIDRGLAYLCGQMPGGDEHGCGGYFCYEHLLEGYVADEQPRRFVAAPCSLCPTCYARWEAAEGVPDTKEEPADGH